MPQTPPPPSRIQPNQSHGFTVEYPSLQRAIITDVVVSQSFNPFSTEDSEIPPHKKFKAIWDTGATASCITNKVVQECGLQPIGMVRVEGVGGVCHVNAYLINALLPNKVGISELKVTEGKITSADVLIGMDIIHKGDMAISNHQNKTKFSFRIPSVAPIDLKDYATEPTQDPQQQNPQKPQPAKSEKIGRNDPCPCGSGKKYKKCCGKGD